MANIRQYLTKIKDAVYGEDIRNAIHDGIKAISDESSDTKEFANTALVSKEYIENAKNEASKTIEDAVRSTISSMEQATIEGIAAEAIDNVKEKLMAPVSIPVTILATGYDVSINAEYYDGLGIVVLKGCINLGTPSPGNYSSETWTQITNEKYASIPSEYMPCTMYMEASFQSMHSKNIVTQLDVKGVSVDSKGIIEISMQYHEQMSGTPIEFSGWWFTKAKPAVRY